MKLYLAIFVLLYAIPGFSQTGDTLRTETPPPKIAQDTIMIPFDTNYIKSAYRLSNTSETFGISNWIWNDKRNLGEILNERPGYLVNFFNDGGRNTINYNRQYEKNIGIFKDGIQINDILFGGFDIENISLNEIDTIEEISGVSSFLYGINSQARAINVITKDVFQPELFSQLRFTQDRYGSENADVYFSQSLSRKLNYQIGANKHSITGRYDNSDFDVWRARFRTNWFISPKANIRFNLNYANIERGLNEGLIYSTEDTLRNPELAKVYNTDAFEKLTNFYYDISFTGRLVKNKNSLTKLKLYSQNSLREYRDPIGGRIENFHSILYGVDLKQNFLININRDIKTDLLIGGNAYFNIFQYNLTSSTPRIHHLTENYYSAITKLDGHYKNFFISVFGRYDRMFEKGKFQYGAEGSYLIYKNNDFSLSAFGGFSFLNAGINYLDLISFNPDTVIYYWNDPFNSYNTHYTEAGIKFNSKYFYAKLNQYGLTNTNEIRLLDGNYEIGLLTKFFDAITVLNFNEGEQKYNNPKFFLKTDVSYHNFFFQDNLNLRIGVNIKYIKNILVQPYYQRFYSHVEYIVPPTRNYIDHLFNMDFYIGARIGSANIAFTFANIFDNFNYDTFLYPWDDRGGAFNSLSRFSITWDFLN